MDGHASQSPLISRRWPLLVALACAVVAIAVGLGIGVVASLGDTVADDPLAGMGDHSPAPQVTPSIAVQGSPTALPIPEALPANAYAPTSPVVVGRIQIPAIGIDEDIQRGITLTAIDRGPGWWPGTAMPGEWGNVVVAAHRTTHSKPFADLHLLEPDDHVIFTTDAGTFTYEVRGTIVVPGDWIDIAVQSEARTATLFACHPPGSDTERIVAKLRLLNPDGTPADPDEALPAMDAEAQRTEHTLVMRQPDL